MSIQSVQHPADDVMAAVVERRAHHQFGCRVSAVLDLSAHLRRITLSAPQFTDFTCFGPDEYFGLMMPATIDGDPDRRAELVLPDRILGNVREAIAGLPEPIRPHLRWYTVAAHRPECAQIDVEIVLHGDDGPGSAWARRAAVGDMVGFRSGGALYRPTADPEQVADTQLLVADETAAPALRAIVAQWRRDGRWPGRPLVHVEVPRLADLGDLRLPPTTVIHERGTAAPGTVVGAVLAESQGLEKVDYAWLCGESGMVTRLRRHLVMERGLPRRSVLFSGYWKLGAARG